MNTARKQAIGVLAILWGLMGLLALVGIWQVIVVATAVAVITVAIAVFTVALVALVTGRWGP